MSYELIYTSAEKGLKTGSRGFCTVAASDDIPPGPLRVLEKLNMYRHLNSPNSPDNPLSCSHWIFADSGIRWHLFSRIADAGNDYTGRSNMLAHHFLLQESELESLFDGNPADLFTSADFFVTRWNGLPRILPHRMPQLPLASPRACTFWKTTTTDAGWGGLLANDAITGRSACLLFPKRAAVLPLFREALAILPPEIRWKTSFSTFFLPCPPNVQCLWKAVVKNEPEEALLLSVTETHCIDLTRLLPDILPNPKTDQLVRIARTGRIPPGFFPEKLAPLENKEETAQTPFLFPEKRLATPPPIPEKKRAVDSKFNTDNINTAPIIRSFPKSEIQQTNNDRKSNAVSVAPVEKKISTTDSDQQENEVRFSNTSFSRPLLALLILLILACLGVAAYVAISLLNRSSSPNPVPAVELKESALSESKCLSSSPLSLYGMNQKTLYKNCDKSVGKNELKSSELNKTRTQQPENNLYTADI